MEVGGVMARTTDARFKVEKCHVDGRDGGVLTIEAPTASGVVLVTYRPHRGQAYTLTLAEVCEMVAWRAAKKLAR